MVIMLPILAPRQTSNHPSPQPWHKKQQASMHFGVFAAATFSSSIKPTMCSSSQQQQQQQQSTSCGCLLVQSVALVGLVGMLIYWCNDLAVTSPTFASDNSSNCYSLFEQQQQQLYGDVLDETVRASCPFVAITCIQDKHLSL